MLFGQRQLSVDAANAMREGRYHAAESIYRQLAQQFPQEAGWAGNLGLALHSQGKYQDATIHLEKSLKLQFSSGIATVLGIDYLKLGKPCQAIAPLEKTDQRAALADALNGCKRYSEAARLFEKLGKEREAGRAYWMARDYSSALKLFRKIAPNFANDAEFHYEMGDAVMRTDGAEAALPYLEKSVAVVPGRATLGKAYVELKRYEEAIPHLEAGVPTDSNLLLPLSTAYKQTGRGPEAARALKLYREKMSQN